jgi:antitoxin CptB
MTDNDLGRLRWRCRRGMLELDAALLAFLDHRYDQAAPDLRQAFAGLLNLEDAEILDLLMGQHAPESPVMARLIALIASPVPKGGH